MKQGRIRLFALTLMVLLLSAGLALASEDGHVTGNVEVGAAGVGTSDEVERANEYAPYRADNGAEAVGKLDLEWEKDGILLEGDLDYEGHHDQNFDYKADFNRVFQLEGDYQEFDHWKDHETFDQLGATMKPELKGGQPRVFSDKTYPDASADQYLKGNQDVSVVDDNANTWEEHYYNEQDNDYIVTHRSWENEADLTLPTLPNITFHMGMRFEEREGQEQAVTSSKCGYCHVSAQGKTIDEETEEFTAGATGKFGLLTVEYEYKNRTFDDNSEDMYYDYATDPKAEAGKSGRGARLLYLNQPEEFAKTPDSEKETHSLKARLDLARNTSVKASYVNSENTSDKDGNSAFTLGDDELETEYESFGGKFATRLGNLRLSVRGSSYEIEAEDNSVSFNDDANEYFNLADMEDQAADSYLHFPDQHWHNAEARDVYEMGFDAVYRLMRYTTLRLGYDYEEVEREEEHLGETETSTYSAAINSRLGKALKLRASYEYQDIDDPFVTEEGTGIAQGIGTRLQDGIWVLNTDEALAQQGEEGTLLQYWDELGPYGQRTLDASTEPDEVNEAKVKATWNIMPRMSATFFMRYRTEENEYGYDQDTYVPGANLWYAPTDKLNLTMAYTFNKQETENQMCVGWYHG